MKIGQQVEDGTIYAGISPDTGKPFFALSADATILMPWKRAMDYAALLSELKANRREDWRLPTQGELHVLFRNRSKGSLLGTFNESWHENGKYWSSTKDPDISVLRGAVHFWDGDKGWYLKDNKASVRLVRSELCL